MRIFSGIQPSGTLHIGNYLAAIKQFVELQNDNELIVCVVDLHAITIPQEPAALRERILDVGLTFLAVGIDPKKATIFIQSDVPAHAELGWILNTMTPIGELERMTQFKDKSQSRRMKDAVLAGILNYPSLMAADILLYKTEGAPVGEDQLQHIELTRSIAERFNNRFGETFVIPKALLKKEAARVMSLQEPERKMSKSDIYVDSFIALTDTPDIIRGKIKNAVTDSEHEIRYDQKSKPAISNLLSIGSATSDRPISDLEHEFAGQTYVAFKEALAEMIISALTPFQERYNELKKDPESVLKILREGSERASAIANKTLADVRYKIGLLA